MGIFAPGFSGFSFQTNSSVTTLSSVASWRSHMRRRGVKRGSKGFSLVELLVVIGVVAVLLGILMPVMGAVRKRARQVKCLNSIRQLGQANQLYADEYTEWNLPARWGW